MMSATLAQHLGLPEAVAGVVARVAKCPKCMSFWCSALILLLSECDPVIAVGLSLLMAYLSHWFGLVLYKLNDLYDTIWQRMITRQRRKK